MSDTYVKCKLAEDTHLEIAKWEFGTACNNAFGEVAVKAVTFEGAKDTFYIKLTLPDNVQEKQIQTALETINDNLKESGFVNVIQVTEANMVEHINKANIAKSYDIKWSPDNHSISLTTPNTHEILYTNARDRYLINILMKSLSNNPMGEEVTLKLSKDKYEELMDKILTIIENKKQSISPSAASTASLTDSERSSINSVNDLKHKMKEIKGEPVDENRDSHKLC